MRWLSIVFQSRLFSLVREFTARTVTILTWGGLRGGISVALALSLPLSPSRDTLVTITYVVVVFLILVQGLRSIECWETLCGYQPVSTDIVSAASMTTCILYGNFML